MLISPLTLDFNLQWQIFRVFPRSRQRQWGTVTCNHCIRYVMVDSHIATVHLSAAFRFIVARDDDDDHKLCRGLLAQSTCACCKVNCYHYVKKRNTSHRCATWSCRYHMVETGFRKLKSAQPTGLATARLTERVNETNCLYPYALSLDQ